MKKFQAGCLGLYRAIIRTGLLNTSWGRAAFETAYWLYKDHYETGPIILLQKWARPNTVVIDVGANVGFFTLQFASWLRDRGMVIAIEPEAKNYARLQRAVAKAGLTAVVELVQAAAADATGEGLLEINPLHPGDHKLGTKGVMVAMTTLDDLLAARGWPVVSLIKVDVQGAEARVLAGANTTIDRFRPALFIEVGDTELKRYGSSAEALLTACTARGYTLHTLGRRALSESLTIGQALTIAKEGSYVDLLMLPVRFHGSERLISSRCSKLPICLILGTKHPSGC